MPAGKSVGRSRKNAAESLLRDMEKSAARMRSLIVSMPAKDLLGYIYAQRMLNVISRMDKKDEKNQDSVHDDLIDETQFLLEYVHAVLASDAEPKTTKFDEAKCVELYKLGKNLKQNAIFYAMATSADTTDGAFGPDTADIEFRAKSTWVLIRGNRYQVLEGEFYRYVLLPHDDVLREIYGIGADEVAIGLQAMTDASRTGHSDAAVEMKRQFDDVALAAAADDIPLEKAMESWATGNPDQVKSAALAVDDMLRGGISNVSRHTSLPRALLADLAYQRGEEVEFFAPGDHAGTPFRTLPARKKPLIQLGDDYYAVDPCFTRDAGYRALLYNLLQRKPEYKTIFNERQKLMSEAAFADILSAQLSGAKVFQEVYYRDPITKQWSENDTLIIVDDVLMLIEAKAGAAATIASPATDFDRHAQSVQDLVVKAYRQCDRFFNYLNSAEEVPLYKFTSGRYVECARVRMADHRIMLPIGLTVESFSPFSTFCKELPQIVPLLGKHAFISLSIDDLFVLKRLLPTSGEFAHYLEVRQSVAGLRGAHLFDEVDHVGAYLLKNRFDHDMADQLKDGKATLALWDGMSSEVDRAFEGKDWESGLLPRQEFPSEVLNLLIVIDSTRKPGWLRAESFIRNLGSGGRNDFAAMLVELRNTLNNHGSRYFIFGNETSFFIWLNRFGDESDWTKINDRASAASLMDPSNHIEGLFIEVALDGAYHTAYTFEISKPAGRTEANAHIYEDADLMKERVVAKGPPPFLQPLKTDQAKRKIGRNELCPCESGRKYKKCHGR